MMRSTTNYITLCILVFAIQSYSPSLAFLIPNAPLPATAIAKWEGQHCPSHAATPTSLYSSVFDMPSREKEDEELDQETNRIKNNIRNNQNKFRLSNIIKRGSPSAAKEMITQVHSLQEYKTHVADVDDALVVVFFTAPWCRTCQRLKPKMKALAAKLKEEEAKDVKLVEIPLLNKESSALFQGLGVKAFPFCHIYHPTEGLVEELKLKRTLWNEFQTTLGEYRQGSCQLQYNKDGTIRNEMRIQL